MEVYTLWYTLQEDIWEVYTLWYTPQGGIWAVLHPMVHPSGFVMDHEANRGPSPPPVSLLDPPSVRPELSTFRQL